MTLKAKILILFFTLELVTSSINCNNPRSDIEEEYCNTKQLIQLYNKKLRILQNILNVTPNVTLSPIQIESPTPSNPNLYVRGNIFKGETVFVPPDKVINQGTFYEINGTPMKAKQTGKIIAINEAEVLCSVGDHLKVYNTKMLNEPKGTQLDKYGIYKQGIRGLILGKSPKILLQYIKNQLYVITKAGYNRNITFQKDILNIIKGYNTQAVYVTEDEFGVISITSSEMKQKKFYLQNTLNGTSDGLSHVYVLTGEGRLFTFDLKTGNQIGSTYLYSPNNISSTMTLCNNKLFIHRQTQPYVLIYNITNKNDVKLHDNITVCKTAGQIQNRIFRYHIQCIGSYASILCGSGQGQSSEWKHGTYLMKIQQAPIQFPKQTMIIGGVVVLVSLYFFSAMWKKKQPKGNQRNKKEEERQVGEQEEEMQFLQKVVGPIKNRSNVKKQDVQNKKNN